MRIAALVKQIPKGEEMSVVDGRLNRSGVPLEVNAYCRRANAQAVALARDAGEPDGEVVVLTMGPPAAEDALREMIACGADRGVHLCDPALAGSDTLATARALSVALVAEGPFDLVLCGLNSLDGDTGQVGPEVAELLGWPFVAGARELRVDGRGIVVTSETDHGYEELRVPLPAVVSCAERLCDPSKADVAQRQEVDPSLVRRLTAAALGLRREEVGASGSPTTVGAPRVAEIARAGRIAVDVDDAVRQLDELGAFDEVAVAAGEAVPETGGSDGEVWCFLDDDPQRPHRELLGEAARIAALIGAAVVALVPSPGPRDLDRQGADRVVLVPGDEADAWGAAVAEAAGAARPRAFLVEATAAGRAVASRVAARHGWGLTGDGTAIDVAADGALTVWKPGLGGRLLAPIWSSSPVQMVTVRPGVLPRRELRPSRPIPVEHLAPGRSSGRVELLSRRHVDSGHHDLARASVVVGVGRGVDPDGYPELRPLLEALGGAELAATRKVTDAGWLPRSRQIGVTGITISPRLFVSIGASGRFNHTSGFQTARVVLAINPDAGAEVFGLADVGLVAPWRETVPALVGALHRRAASAGRALEVTA